MAIMTHAKFPFNRLMLTLSFGINDAIKNLRLSSKQICQ